MNFVAAHSGHWYFTLHDGDSQFKAACYIRNQLRKFVLSRSTVCRFACAENFRVYQPKGEYQILVESLEPVGEGALKVAFEQIKLKLGKERLFDEEFKTTFAAFSAPCRCRHIAERRGVSRYFKCHLAPHKNRQHRFDSDRVQGEMAGEEIRSAINLANEFNKTASEKEKIDVLIVGRGGGSSGRFVGV